MERASLPGGIPAGELRDEYPAALLLKGRARQTGRLLHARVQPCMDEPRWHKLDRGPDQRAAGGTPRRPDTHLERNGLVRRLRTANGRGQRASRSDEPGDARRALDRLSPAGAARV